MSQKFNPRLVTSDDTYATVARRELRERELEQISGGSVKWGHDDEAPKETTTFEYGGLVIRYGQQDVSGSIG